MVPSRLRRFGGAGHRSRATIESPAVVGRSRLPRQRSALDLEIFSRGFAPAGNHLKLDALPLVQAGQTGSLDRRDVNEDVLAAVLKAG
jgi:hypothetical protein